MVNWIHHNLFIFCVEVLFFDCSCKPLIIPVDVPITGRSVLLEQPRKSGSKVISHMLSSHGGEIFLHVLNSNRSTLEDPPSISEGCGGRVTDYRITVCTAPISCSEIFSKVDLVLNVFCFFTFFSSGFW